MKEIRLIPEIHGLEILENPVILDPFKNIYIGEMPWFTKAQWKGQIKSKNIATILKNWINK